jgi:hypothetical protein
MATNERVEWIVPGLVVKGGITELGAKVKAGKTTLIMKLVSASAGSDFHVLLHNDTRGMTWTDVAAAAVSECKRVGAYLLVVDTLPQFAGLRGDSENNSGDALAAMEPLLRAASEGVGVMLTRHERKSGGEVGDSGRGSSAFAGAVDIVLSLRRPEGNAKKTLRVLQAL